MDTYLPVIQNDIGIYVLHLCTAVHHRPQVIELLTPSLLLEFHDGLMDLLLLLTVLHWRTITCFLHTDLQPSDFDCLGSILQTA